MSTARLSPSPAKKRLTRQRSTASAARDADTLLTAVLDAALDCVVTIDEHGRIQEFNAAAERTFGYRRSDVIGRVMADVIVPPKLRDAHRRGLSSYLDTGERRIIGRRIETEAMRHDGATFAVELTVTQLQLNGRPAFTAYMRDISERIESDRRLVIANSLYQDLIESLPVVVYEADFGADGTWRYVSRQIEDLLGFPAAEWLADPTLWFRQVHVEDREVPLAQERALRSRDPGARAVCEYRMLTRSGQTLWLRDTAVVVPGDGEATSRMRGVLVDVTERKDLEAQLTRHAFYDSLTGLPNRALFMDRVQEAIARASRRSEGMIGVLFIDIDDFKVVNDTLGHVAGDALLGEIGKRLTAGLRPSDTPSRFGGDEFTVLLDELHGPDEALQLAARLADRVAEPVRIDGRDIVVTVSIGIGITADVEITAPDLVRQADIAMYRAKENGKARVELYDVAMSAEAWRQLDLQRDLRQAVQRGELSVYYQPVVELETGCIQEVEALVRWEHPQRGMLLPGDFIPFAEATGLITQIDNLVLRQAARQVSAWRRRFEAARSLMLAVNVSPLDFREAALVDQVVQALRDTGLPASSLTVELTEGASMPGMELVTAAIARLRTLGVRVVIDDFGVGFGGLDYVKRFRVHGLKIDRSFVEGIADRPEDAAVVGAMLAFGNALGLSVVAEGIETADQLAVLRRLGCDRGQGYLLARPMPPEALEEMLTRNLSLCHP